jgi:hypothetical protein
LRLFFRLLMLILILVGLCLAVVLYYVANPKLPAWSPAQQVHYLDQWSDTDRQTYYFTPQGTQVKGLHYDWFTALELPFSQQRFASPEYLARFGFLIDPNQKPTPNNPEIFRWALPGTKTRKRGYVSGYHLCRLPYRRTAFQRPGRAHRWRFGAACPALQRAYTARWQFRTSLGRQPGSDLLQPWKFERFARQVLGQDYDARRQQLRQEFKQSLILS